MRKISCIATYALMALLLSSIHVPAAGAEKIKVSILPLRAPEVSENTALAAFNVIRKSLSSEKYQIPAGNEPAGADLELLYRENGTSPDPAVLKSIALKSGTLKIIAGIISRRETGYSIDCSLFDAQSGTIEYETSETSPDEPGIEESSRQAAVRISMKLDGILPLISGVNAGEGNSIEYVPVIWQAIQEAGEYYIYRSSSEAGEFRSIGRSAAAPFSDADAIPGVRYWYRVRGVMEGIFTDFSSTVTGYRKIPPPAGLSLDDILKERTGTPAAPAGETEKAKILQDEGVLKSYYMEPMQLTLVMYFAASYIKSGRIIILRDFDTCTQKEDSREIVLTSGSSPYIINFKSKRLFRIREKGGTGLFERLVHNSIFYCAYTGDREIIMEDGTRYMVPGFEAVGMSTGYYRNDRKWRERTIMLETDNKEYAEQIKKAGGG